MKSTDLQPGGIYRGANGQVREIVTMEGIKLTYRMINLGSKPGPRAVAEGRVSDPIGVSRFLEWALEIVA